MKHLKKYKLFESSFETKLKPWLKCSTTFKNIKDKFINDINSILFLSGDLYDLAGDYNKHIYFDELPSVVNLYIDYYKDDKNNKTNYNDMDINNLLRIHDALYELIDDDLLPYILHNLAEYVDEIGDEDYNELLKYIGNDCVDVDFKDSKGKTFFDYLYDDKIKKSIIESSEYQKYLKEKQIKKFKI